MQLAKTQDCDIAPHTMQCLAATHAHRHDPSCLDVPQALLSSNTRLHGSAGGGGANCMCYVGDSVLLLLSAQDVFHIHMWLLLQHRLGLRHTCSSCGE
jgi:hypothetical protein